MANKIQHRRDTAANWTSANPVLSAGEPAYETDTNRRKVGDGVTPWRGLPHALDSATLLPLRATGKRFRTLTIMVYHAVPTLSIFQTDCDYYQEWNYTTVTFDDVWNHMQGTSTLPDKPLLITFDDGIPTQYNAVQELNTRGMKSTLFVATGWIDGTVTQAQGGFAEATPLTWTQINQMKAWGCDIQSHTVNHQDQSTLTGAQSASEYSTSKSRIEAQVSGQTVNYLAYPYGGWNEATRTALLGAGCRLARQVRTAADGSNPGANLGRYAISTTLTDKFGLTCAGTSNGDIQQPNYFRSLSHDPEHCPDFGFEAGGKGWQLGSGFTVDTTDAYTGTKSLHAVQQTSTASSRPLRNIPTGRWVRLQIKLRIKTVGLPSGTLTKLQVQPLKADGTVIATTDAITVTGNNGAWTEYVYEYVGGATDAELQVYCWLQGNASPTGAAWFDVLSIKRENLPVHLNGF